MQAAARAPHGLLDRLADHEVVDLRARHHHLAGAQVAEDEHVLGELTLVGLDQPLVHALRQQHAQLVLGVRRVAHLARRRDAERLEHQVAEPVEGVDDRLGDEVEGTHRPRDPEHRPGGARDGERLRRELAEHHVQHGHDRQREDEAQPDRDAGGDGADQRLQDVLEGGLGERAEADAGDGDAELAGGQVGVDLLHGAARRLGAGLSLPLELDDLAEAHTGDGELGRDEEGVEGDEPEGREDAQRLTHRRWPASGSGSSSTRGMIPGAGKEMAGEEGLEPSIP